MLSTNNRQICARIYIKIILCKNIKKLTNVIQFQYYENETIEKTKVIKKK